MPVRTNSKNPAEEPNPPALPPWIVAAQAAESKKGGRVRVLDVGALTSFADYFVVCSGSNQRQIQAIADEVQQRLKEQGRGPIGLEGYDHAEWVLVDYGDFLVHIFSESARSFYDLERLWRQAKEVEVPAG